MPENATSHATVGIADQQGLSGTQAGSTRPDLPRATGRLGLLCLIAAVALPTAIRAAIDGYVTGCEFTPYLPFVLLAAALVGWWQAGLVALVSVAVFAALFVGSPSSFLASACAESSAGVFLGSSALIIIAVTMVRHLIAQLLSRRSDPSAGGIIFSLDKNEVWASWDGSSSPMHLGSRERVEAMMADFLAQGELDKRLSKQSCPDS